MAGIKLEAFQGLIPRSSPRLLPPMAATVARNTKLLNGEIRGFSSLRENTSFSESFTVRRIFRVPDSNGVLPDAFLRFDSRDVDVIRSPLVNDAHDRYFWAGDGRPMMNTGARIHSGDPGFYLGVPTPAVGPTLTPAVGSGVTRSYVYTFVSAYGEEGPPSPPTVSTGGSGQWDLSAMATTVSDAANRNITHKNIYRTVPGETSTSFFFVAQVTLAAATYSDNESDQTVAANPLLESISFVEPPAGLEGFVSMPNGYLVGWVGRRLVFSEAYRPHAWPAEYELATEFDIVGLVVWGTTLVIGTQSQPYFGQGNSPASFTMQKMDAVEPCLSRRGMVATVAGAYYPSINGLVLANASGVRVITQDILTKEEWATYTPSSLYAAQLGLQYIAFNSPTFGLIFNPTEPHTKLVELEGFTGVEGIETDRYSGDVLILKDNTAWDWDRVGSQRLQWRWKSKLYQTPKPVNFGAARLQFDHGSVDVEQDTIEFFGGYNTQRFAAGPLNTLGGHVLCGPPQGAGLVLNWTEPELRTPLGGSLLYPLSVMTFQNLSVRVIVHIRDRIVLDTVVTDERLIRLPTGFKSDIWQFEFVGNTNVYSFQVAETPRQLRTV